MSLAKRMQHYLTAAGEVENPAHQRFLLAVSGGKDSVVMAHLFAELGLPFGIGHCNFQLRGSESDGDADFVKELAGRLGCSFHLAAFDTNQVAREWSVSIQTAARRLRYDWLEQVRQTNDYDFIATAHHLTDSIETQLHHLVRGAGLKGLLGIPPRNGSIVRPLLFARGGELAAYQESHQLPFREDRSNAEVKYTRNFIRHRILPALQQLNPNLENTLGENIQRLKESAWLMDQMLAQIRADACTVEGERVVYKLEALRAYAPALPTVLFELLSSYGLNTAQAEDLAEAIKQAHVGRLFLTPTHELATAADTLEVVPANQPAFEPISVPAGEEQVSFPGGRLTFELLDRPPSGFSSNPNLAYFDAAALRFPLQLRKWQPGDQFQPFGMNGQHQKLQDYFSNNKFSRAEKAAAWLLVDAAGHIAWVVGHRSSHLHRVQKQAQKCWRAEVYFA